MATRTRARTGGIQPIHLLIGAGVALGAILLWPKAPVPARPDPVLQQARADIAAAKLRVAGLPPEACQGVVQQLQAAAAAYQATNPQAAAELLAAAASLCAGGGPNPLPNPVAPGLAAQPNDDVTVDSAQLAQLGIVLPPGVSGEVLVRVATAGVTDLQGAVTAVSSPLGTVSVPPIQTPNFPRALVTRVTRNGVVIA